MFSLRSFRARGVNRGKPGLPGGHGRRLALLGILIATCLLETGCQSGPFSPCGCVGSATSRFVNRFHRNRSEPCCGTEVVSDGGCISSGVPIGATIAPVIIQNAPVGPGGATPSNMFPSDTPTNLDAMPPRAAPGPEPSGAIRRPSGSKTSSSYETLRPDTRSNRSRGDNLAHTLISTPVPAARSAQESSRAVAHDTSATDGDGESVLDHLPPLDLPSDVTEKSTTPPVAPPAQRRPIAPAPASDHLSGRSSRESDLTLTGTSLPAPEPVSSAGGAPGIARFVAVDLKLAGGSAPSAAGLDWLAQKGYKTLVDLREASESDLSFIAEATRRGLRYIALPVSLETIDRAHLDRFQFELAIGEARPLYFFDSDGTRAGALWYIRRIAVDRVNSEIARREAEDLGLSNADYWLAARNYLERLDNPRSGAAEATGPVSSADSRQTAKPSSQPAGTPEPPQSRPLSPAAQAPSGPTAPATAPAPTPAPAAVMPVDTTAWHPFAAIVITGLTFPLAYLSRSVVPTILARTLASLPAPARRWKSLPHELDA
jgi:protein tyrosine phosphatase (PTP) superfamily phosphohydrolase (DUF442 family)